MWNEHSCMVVWTFFSLPFLEIRIKTDLFQSCGHCWVFQICWLIECTTLTASSSRILNSLAGVPSPPLTLLIVMLPKTHLTSHSRMHGSRWVTIPLWLYGLLRPVLDSSSVYSCHFFLISYASISSLPFLSFIVPNFAWNIPLVSLIFLISSLSHSVVFLYLCIDLWKAFLSLLAILWNSAFIWVYLSFSFAFHFSSFLSYL